MTTSYPLPLSKPDGEPLSEAQASVAGDVGGRRRCKLHWVELHNLPSSPLASRKTQADAAEAIPTALSVLRSIGPHELAVQSPGVNMLDGPERIVLIRWSPGAVHELAELFECSMMLQLSVGHVA